MSIWLVLLSFGIGSIPFAAIISMLFGRKKTLSKHEKNTGARKVYCSLGKLPGLLTLMLDILKGFILMVIVFNSGSSSLLSMAFLALGLIGHSFSPFLGFKGGQGVAMLLGGMIYFFPLIVAISGVFFFILRKFIRSFDLQYTLAVILFLIASFFIHDLSFNEILFMILLFLFPLFKGFCFPHK